MATEKKLIPFKSANLSLISKRIDKIEAKLRPHYNSEPTGESFNKFVEDVHSCFSATIRYDVIYASLMHMAGKLMTREVIHNQAWRLAANMDKLKEGIPVPPWIKQTELEWCPIVILKADPGRGYDNTFGFFYQYRVLAGSAASLKFTTFWSIKYARFIARSVGFKRFKKTYFKFVNGRDMVQMRLYVLFDPALSRDERPSSYHFSVPTSCRVYNQKILQQRFRITPCPLKYTLSELPCYKCPMGYDKCGAGCHPFTFKRKGCPRCSQEGWFDPLGRNVICVDCEDKERNAKKKV